MSSPFCALPDADCFQTASLGRAFLDKYPVTDGHVLIVPRRHVATWFDATREEQVALTALIDSVRAQLERMLPRKPNGWNIGINVGAAGGQTVPHLHVHVIPRYDGDVPDPRGGVRFVIPHKANYLDDPGAVGAPHALSVVSGGSDPLLPQLLSHLERASRVDAAISFTMESGVGLIEQPLRRLIERGGTMRFLTGSYLGVTQPDALARLLELGSGAELRVFDDGKTSFHLKCWILHDHDGRGTAFVGSSNLSRTALGDGIEWNYRVLTSRDGEGFRDVVRAFETLFVDQRTVPLTLDWVGRYWELRTPPTPIESGVPVEPKLEVPKAHPVQEGALDALSRTRDAGNSAGLVVLATGLGKTWLSAFDTVAMGAKRVLFVAHRDEILDQALGTYRKLHPTASLGKYTGEERDAEADIVFASIQTIGRSHHLDRFQRDHFDYIVVDEFHHAAARSYQRLLEHFTPRFLLGLTATPERTDGADLLALCGGNLVYRCDLIEGITRRLLSPFDYYGVPDEVDYTTIPWRSTYFDVAELTARVSSEKRAHHALDELKKREWTRALVFCVSQGHADYMRDFLRSKGLKAAAVHAGPTSDPREASLARLKDGSLPIICAVDMFNEGLDVPEIDAVLMLRPTESSIVWLQQFGRGLRPREGKRLKVIDWIGNHRSFWRKPEALFDLTDRGISRRDFVKLLQEGRASELLPPDCFAEFDLTAIDILAQLVKAKEKPAEALRAWYEEFRERNGVRPTPAEAVADGQNPDLARRSHESWFGFVEAMGDLGEEEREVLREIGPFLLAVETAPMAMSYKMLVLLGMLNEGAFPGEIGIDRLVARVREIATRAPAVRDELGELLGDDRALRRKLEEMPIAKWVEGRGSGGKSWFSYESGRFATRFTVPERLRQAAGGMVRELADWQLADYLRRPSVRGTGAAVVCKVSHNGRNPILFYQPGREQNPQIPRDWVKVIADGKTYEARFAKIAINVVREPGGQRNVLPDVLRGWFGEAAGEPGLGQYVQIVKRGGGWEMSGILTPTRGDQVT